VALQLDWVEAPDGVMALAVSFGSRVAWLSARPTDDYEPEALAGQLRQQLREVLELVVAELLLAMHERPAVGSLQGEPPAGSSPGLERPSSAGRRYVYPEIIGESPAMQELYRLLDRVIESDSTVLVQGENGTGKELIARAIHLNASRGSGPFIVHNAAAFNDNLLDSELFGHRRGSFTGAVGDKAGLFEMAHGGTFFLDEVGDMSPVMQVKLLRVLQEGTFVPVGDTQVRKVDVRLVAATNCDLRARIASGDFREDLFYRINVLSVTVPPLRERRGDIPLLIEHFVTRYGRRTRVPAPPTTAGARHEEGASRRAGTPRPTFTRECVELLVRYPWPGNVRELEHELERMIVLAGPQRPIDESFLSPHIRESATRGGEELVSQGVSEEEGSLPDALETLERRMIGEALRRFHGNKSRAADALRISRRNLIRKAQKYHLG
jgi:transcriptional regulator with PAS, ATPase and Fis domain